MMVCLFGELLNRLRIVLGYWCEKDSEQWKLNDRSMAIEERTDAVICGNHFCSCPVAKKGRAALANSQCCFFFSFSSFSFSRFPVVASLVTSSTRASLPVSSCAHTTAVRHPALPAPARIYPSFQQGQKRQVAGWFLCD